MKNKNLMMLVSLLGLYLISAGISLAVFSLLKKPSSSSLVDKIAKTPISSKSRVKPGEPKTEICPINASVFTKTEKDIWETRRPLATMIENSSDSRPPSGLSRADVVYEAVAEGGITRFMGIFYCNVAGEDVQLAPVRSARIYFIEWASEYGKNPIFMHVGGANNYSGSGDTVREARALETLETIGWRVPKGNDFDTTYDSGFPIFWRNYDRLDHSVATEHTMMASTDAVYKEAASRGFTNVDKKGTSWSTSYTPWKFMSDNPNNTSSVNSVSFSFWSGKPEYDVEWKYDPGTNSYIRFNGGVKHLDLEYQNKELSAKNVVIEKVKERGPVDKNLHMLYTTIGKGEAFIFQNGNMITGSWQKTSREARTKFFDSGGKEINFVPGVVWIEAIPSQNDIKY